MWAKQLRVYSQASKEKVTVKRTESAEVGFSLYSSASENGEEDQGTQNKDLNSCARLLTEIMDLGGPTSLQPTNKMKQNKTGNKPKTDKPKAALKSNKPSKDKTKITAKRLPNAKATATKSTNATKGKKSGNTGSVKTIQEDKENINSQEQQSVSSEASSGIPAFKKPLPDPLNSPVPSDVMQPPKVQKQLVRPATTYEVTRNPSTPLVVAADIKSHVPFNTRLRCSTPTGQSDQVRFLAECNTGLKTSENSTLLNGYSQATEVNSKGTRSAVAMGPHCAVGIRGDIDVLNCIYPYSQPASVPPHPHFTSNPSQQSTYFSLPQGHRSQNGHSELFGIDQTKNQPLPPNYLYPLTGQTFPQRMQQLFSQHGPSEHLTHRSGAVKVNMNTLTGISSCQTPGESGYLSTGHYTAHHLSDSLAGNISYGDSKVPSSSSSASSLCQYVPTTSPEDLPPPAGVTTPISQFIPVPTSCSQVEALERHLSALGQNTGYNIDGTPSGVACHPSRYPLVEHQTSATSGRVEHLNVNTGQEKVSRVVSNVIHIPQALPEIESDLEEDTIPTRDPGAAVVMKPISSPKRIVHFMASHKETDEPKMEAELQTAETQTDILNGCVKGMHGKTKNVENASVAQVDNMTWMFQQEYPQVGQMSYPKKLTMENVRAQFKMLHFLVREIRGAANQDQEVDRLTGEVEHCLGLLQPGLSTLDWQTEINLALQPLRSENAQLRRQLRILGYQLRDTQTAVEQAEKPDPSLQALHLEVQCHALQNQVKEANTKSTALQQKVNFLATEVDKLTKEKQEMLQLLCHKDDDHLKSHQDWLEEVTILRTHAKAAEDDKHRSQQECRRLEEQLHLMEIAAEQKDKENTRLNELVGDLQGSMSRLLDDLKTLQPTGLFLPGLGETPGLAWLHTGAGLGPDSSPSSSSVPKDIIDYTSPLKLRQPQTNERPLTRSLPSQKEEGHSVLPHHEPVHFASKTYGRHHAQLPVTGYDSVGGGPTTAFGQILTEDALREHDQKDATGDTGEISMYPIENDSSQSENIYQGRLEALSVDGVRYVTGDMESTQYLFPPGVVTHQRPIEHRKVGHTSPTVKDILGSFSEWMRQSPSVPVNKTPPSQKIFQPKQLEMEGELVENDDEENGSSEDDRDNTLTADQGPSNDTGSPEDSSTQSRYSVTDYFHKYPLSSKAGLDKQVQNSISNSSLTHLKTVPGHRELGQESSGIDSSTSPKISEQSSAKKSSQESLYQGTVLDTSISTVKDTESSVITSVTSSSLATVTSVDEEAFRNGLANLDANILRIQQSLRNTLKK